MDEAHLELLRQIFWDMNRIDYTTEPYTEEVTVEVPAEDSADEDGVTEEVQTVERTRLVITITSKTANTTIVPMTIPPLTGRRII